VTPSPACGDAVALTKALVAVDSRNPALAPNGPGERECALVLAAVLADWGFTVELQESAAGRPNVVARIGRSRRHNGSEGRALLFNGHLDTVGVEGMIHAPWDPLVRDGKLYGRGSSDMKAGVAAMCAAAARAARLSPNGLGGEVVVAAVTDEEYQSAGTRALVESGIRADAAVVTEPTRLAICSSHRGFAWLELVVHGRAAHGSRWDIGVDAIALAALVVAELELYQEAVLAKKSHHLLGRASLHASIVTGGTEISTYPDRCAVQFERRTLPGETAADFTREVEEACARVRERRPELHAEVRPGFAQAPNEVAPDHPIVRALGTALGYAAERTPVEGLECWTDAALLTAAGIPAICFGPGDIALAHAAEEYVMVAEIERATHVLATLIGDWFGQDSSWHT
jgi:acetylornithine deacetylase